MTLTQEENPELRYDGALLLWRAAAAPEVRRRLVELTYDDHAHVRATAVRELAGAVSEPNIRARLISLLSDQMWRCAATQ